jgi:hypothetical protein
LIPSWPGERAALPVCIGLRFRVKVRPLAPPASAVAVVAQTPLHHAKRDGRCHYMFVRYRQTETRLQVSLVETRR